MIDTYLFSKNLQQTLQPSLYYEKCTDSGLIGFLYVDIFTITDLLGTSPIIEINFFQFMVAVRKLILI